jgi:hypothetical protein
MLRRVMLACDSFALVGWTSTPKGGLTISQVIQLCTPKKTLHINCGEFKYEFISSRGTNSKSLLLDGVDVALTAYQLVVRSTSL